MLLAILRCEVLGQHCCFSAQLPQSCCEALKRTVPALVGRPVLVSFLPAGHSYVLARESKWKSGRLNVPSSRSDFSHTGMCGSIFFSLTIQLSIGAAP